MTSDSCNVPEERHPGPESVWSSSERTSSPHSRQPSGNIINIPSYSAPRSAQNKTAPLAMRSSNSLRTNRSRSRHMDLETSDHQATILRDVELTRHSIGKAREDMDKLTKKLQGMAEDITKTKTRVSTYIQNIGNMEQSLVSTQEVNVNLQILLERAVSSQKRLDIDTMQRVRQFQGDLSQILVQNEEMHSRISSMESTQYTYDGRVADLNHQVREYATLLEQARDTIHAMTDTTPASSEEYVPSESSRRASLASSWATEDETVGRKESEITSVVSKPTDTKDILRSRIIRSSGMSSEKGSSTGLKLLLSDKTFQKTI